MARKVFFSFHYKRDVFRVANVRNSSVIGKFDKSPFYDKAEWESIKRQGDEAVKRWINSQLSGTSVTVVLVGTETASRKWVKYEIARSIELRKGLIAIDISKIRDQNGNEDPTGENPLPAGYAWYRWNKDNGRANLGTWIDKAAEQAGR